MLMTHNVYRHCWWQTVSMANNVDSKQNLQTLLVTDNVEVDIKQCWWNNIIYDYIDAIHCKSLLMIKVVDGKH